MEKLLERLYDEERKKIIKKLSFKKSKTIRVVPIPKTGSWYPRNSEGDALKNRAKVRFTVPFNTTNRTLLDPLSHLKDEEKDELAKSLGLGDRQDLNPLKPGKDNYWKNRSVILDGNGLILDIGNPSQYIEACILLSDFERIAPSWNTRKDKGTYLFAIVDDEAETKEKTSKSKLNSKAYKLFFDIEKSTDKLESVVWIRYWSGDNYSQPSEKANRDWLYSEVEAMVRDKPREFIDIVGDGKFEIKANIIKGLKDGILKRKGQNIMFADADTTIGTFGETIEYFNSSQHEADYAKLIDQLSDKEKVKK